MQKRIIIGSWLGSEYASVHSEVFCRRAVLKMFMKFKESMCEILHMPLYQESLFSVDFWNVSEWALGARKDARLSSFLVKLQGAVSQPATWIVFRHSSSSFLVKQFDSIYFSSNIGTKNVTLPGSIYNSALISECLACLSNYERLNQNVFGKGSSIKCVRKIFRKTNIPYPLIRTLMHVRVSGGKKC